MFSSPFGLFHVYCGVSRLSHIQSNFDGSNIFGSMEFFSGYGYSSH